MDALRGDDGRGGVGRSGTAHRLVSSRRTDAGADGRAGTLLWRATRVRASALAWADPVAWRLLAGCGPDVEDLLRRDVHALLADRPGGSPEVLVRRLARRTSDVLVARSSACEAVPGVVVVTTIELEPPPPPAASEGASPWGLTPREAEVARLAAEGLGSRAIAFQLGIATATVGVHLTRVFRKTGALDRQALTRLLLRPGP